MQVKSKIHGSASITIRGQRSDFSFDEVITFSEFLRDEVLNEIVKYPEGSFEILSEGSAAVEEIVGMAPESLNTLQEIAEALNNNPDFAQTILDMVTLKISKGEKSIFVLDNGEFENGQAAIDSAEAGSTLFFGPKAGGWGDIELKSGVDIMGIGHPMGDAIQFGKIKFAPESGNAGQNTCHLSNVFAFAGTAEDSSLEVKGTVPLRLRISGCYFYKGSGEGKIIDISNTQAGSSVYIDDSLTNSNSAFTGVAMDVEIGYLKSKGLEITGGSKGLIVRSGLTWLTSPFIEYNKADHVIEVVGGTLSITRGGLKNSFANSSLVQVDLGAQFKASYLEFDLAVGSGYAVKGEGAFVYNQISFPHVAGLNPRNVNIQNTLTIIPLVTEPVSVA